MYKKHNALRLIGDSLKRIGYSETSLVKDYFITTSGNTAIKLDLVAFGDNVVHDTTTSCISVRWCENGSEKTTYLEEAKYIATPIMLLPQVEKVEIWNVKIKEPTKIYTLKYDELYPYFQRNRFDFASDKIVEAKYGIRQLTLFETLGLVEFAENANYHILGQEFKKGLYTGKKLLDQLKIKGGHNYSALTSITMHILAAIILSNKLYPNEKVENVHLLMDKLSHQFKNYFNKEYIYKLGSNTIQAIFEELDKNINYRSLNNEMLGHFYESTLFEEDELEKNKIRRKFGIYYTPKALGEDILSSIPVETIRDSERYVLDGSCGSGSLLINAYKRLEKLLPISWSPNEKHDYLTNKIAGFEVDKFAKEVARLALLLYSLPNGNSWNIKTRDTLKINRFTRLNYPMVIIGNPPFEEIRKGNQQQKALDFMIKYMDWLKPKGYLGIILPESFLENNSGNKVRQQLLHEFDILEVWSLPGKIFEKNNCATTVILAQKHNKLEGVKYPVKIRIVTRNNKSIKRYLESKRVDFEFIYSNQNEWLRNKNCVIHFSPIDKVLKKIENNKRFEDVTKHIQGVQIPFSKNYPLVSKEFRDGYSKFIQNADNCFHPYSLKWAKQKNYKYLKYDESLKNVYEGLRLRTSYRDIYEKQKVLIKLSSTPGEFWCVSAAIDREICYPSHSFYCAIPKVDNISLEELTAIINSKIANAYIRSLSVKRTLVVNCIKSLPIPDFTKGLKYETIKLVKQLEDLKRSGNDKSTISDLTDRLDNIVNIAYGLSEDDIDLLNTYYNKYLGIDHIYNAVDVHNSSPLDNRLNVWNFIGEVTDLDVDKMLLQANFVELNGCKDVRITNNLPGWLLRKGACFTAEVGQECICDDVIEISNVKPLEFTYLDDEELIHFVENKKINKEEEVLI